VPTHVRWERGEWALASTPAAFDSRALSALAEGREMHALGDRGRAGRSAPDRAGAARPDIGG